MYNTIDTTCTRCRDFQSTEKKSAKIKCLPFIPKPQKLPVIRGYQQGSRLSMYQVWSKSIERC